MSIASTLSFLQDLNGAITTATFNAGAAPLTFSISNNLRVQIDSNGYLLINTSTSYGSYHMQVNGNALITGGLTVTTATIGTIIGTVSSATSAQNITFSVDSGSATQQYLAFVSSNAGGVLAPKTYANLTYVPSTGLLSVGSLSVSGASTLGSLTVSGATVHSGTTNLGAVGNITITGGTSGQYLSTNGAGGLSWATVTGGGGGASVTISDSAPASPSAGNLWWDSSIGNLAIYYNDGDSSQWVDAVSSYVFPSTVNNLNITTSTQSVSTTTGALVVTGGVGIGGALYVQGPMFVSGLAVDAGSTLTNLVLTSTASSTSTTTGALIVTGGAGIGGSVNIGGSLIVGGTAITPISISDTAPVSPSSGQLWWDSSVGNLAIYYNDGDSSQWVDAVSSYVFPSSVNNLIITTSTQASSTVTGALVVTGGAGIGGAMYVASTSYIAGAQIITTATIGNYAAASGGGTGTTSTFVISNITSSTNTFSGALQVWGGVGIGGNMYVGGTTVLQNATNSTSTNTGALIVRGGIGLSGNLYINGTIVDVTTGIIIGGQTTGTTSTFVISNTSTSTSTTTGALVVAGGVGIGGTLYAGAIYSGGTLVSSGRATVSDTAPTNPLNGQLWWDSSVGNLAIYYNDGDSNQWVDAVNTVAGGSSSSSSSSSTAIVTVSDSAPASPSTGTLWWDSSVGNLAIYYNDGDSSQWVDAVNSISAPSSVGTLAITGVTVATSTTTGALTVAGGVGIQGNLYVGGTIGDGAGNTVSGSTVVKGSAKAWVIYTVSGTTPTIVSSFNIASVTYNSTGYYSFTFTTALPNANYGVAGTSGIDTGTINFTIPMCFGTPGSPYYSAPTTTGFTMCFISANTQNVINPKVACITVFD